RASGSYSAEWKGCSLPAERTDGDSRLVFSNGPDRREGSAPRCRLVTSWGWIGSQGVGCSTIKVVRELGSDRRETGRSLSAVGAGDLRGAAPSTRGPEWTDRWCASCVARRTAG